MKFSAVILTVGFAALAAAQSASTSASVATPTQTSSYPTQVASCLGKCQESDVTCRAQCLGSAAPNDSSANATNECVKKCPQGNGTQVDTDKYASCVNSCINTIFLSTSSAATATGNSGSGSGSGSGGGSSHSGSANPTSSGSKATGTSSGAGSSTTPNAGTSVKVGGSFLALFGMAAGILAL
ncbi:hypothetical protein L873DRAFT_1836847 [Choiromyces venosus 120613-1]|uniref:Extracellular membrane protein CFEM domain-containing protein n=1 Tax=Choiromyces venosus 120613-1 TaxID=1336337 RepID=A0A3N4JQP7_9PEZI|nr:hypothetical protein L873DRAFT_1836847 [Choiromyces venosus 120613-1]